MLKDKRINVVYPAQNYMVFILYDLELDTISYIKYYSPISIEEDEIRNFINLMVEKYVMYNSV